MTVLLAQLDRDETVAQSLAQEREPLRRHQRVAVEAQPEDPQAMGAAPGNGVQVPIAAIDRALARRAHRNGQRRLGQHRCDHHRVDRHGQGEAAGETHPHDADPRATTPLMLPGRESTQPAGDRRGPPGCQHRELAAYTRADYRPPVSYTHLTLPTIYS